MIYVVKGMRESTAHSLETFPARFRIVMTGFRKFDQFGKNRLVYVVQLNDTILYIFNILHKGPEFVTIFIQYISAKFIANLYRSGYVDRHSLNTVLDTLDVL